MSSFYSSWAIDWYQICYRAIDTWWDTRSNGGSQDFDKKCKVKNFFLSSYPQPMGPWFWLSEPLGIKGYIVYSILGWYSKDRRGVGGLTNTVQPSLYFVLVLFASLCFSFGFVAISFSFLFLAHRYIYIPLNKSDFFICNIIKKRILHS